jgi:molybdopterin/thiamine biosynthesis adenylyltransferase
MNSSPLSLTENQIERYSREIILPEIGSQGIEKLLSKRVTIIGAGGLGSPALQILVGAGIGKIRIIENDIVDISNLPRQILYTTSNIGEKKADAAIRRLKDMNPDVEFESYSNLLTKINAVELLTGSDYVIEATDNIGVKFLVNDVCVHLNIPFSIAGVVKFSGHIVSVQPGQSACYRCLFDTPAADPSNFSCAEAGILATASVFGGTIQAHEAIAALLKFPNRLINKILTFDLYKYAFYAVPFSKDPHCKACANPAYEYFKEAEYGESNATNEEGENPCKITL